MNKKRKQRLINCSNMNSILDITNSYCVYYVYFGDKFYIGSTSNIHRKITLFTSNLNLCYEGEMESESYEKIVKFLKTSSIQSFTIKIYAYCADNHSMGLLEKWLLEKHLKNENCLN